MNRTFKRIVIGILIAVAGLFALVYGIGFALPTEHVAAVRADYFASPEEIFAAVADYRSHPEWRPSVEEIEELPARNGKRAWVEISATGSLPMELTEIEPPTRIVTTIISEGMPFGGRWVFDIEPTASGTTVTVTEEGEVYSPVFRVVSRFLVGHHATASRFLSDLGTRLGETPTIEVVR